MEKAWNIDWSKLDRFDNGGQGGTVPTGSDDEVIAEFYMNKVPNFDGTDYVEVPHVRIVFPGMKTVYDQPVRLETFPDRPSDPERFPNAWARFQIGEQLGNDGTSLADWGELAKGDIRRLELNGVMSVRQLATVPDSLIDGLGFGARMLRDKARAYLSGKASMDPEKQAMQEQIGKLTDVVTNLMATLQEHGLQISPREPEAAGEGDAGEAGAGGEPSPAGGRRGRGNANG